jgi:BASS family bile acid:Na+ symporter
MAANIGLILLSVIGLVLNFDSMIALVGSLGLLAGFLFVVAALAAGYLTGGSSSTARSVTGLGAGQRNISAALVVAAQNFDADVVTYLMVIAIIGFVVLFPVAGELGKRESRAEASPSP